MSNLHLLTDWVEYNGRSSRDLGLTLNLQNFAWNHPQVQIDYISIPGASKDVAFLEDKFNAVNQTFNFVLEREQRDLLKRSSDVVAWVSNVDNYKKLRTNLYPDYYFWALPANLGSFDRPTSFIGSFTLEFKLKPYAFAENSDIYLDVTNGADLINNESFDSLPRFHLVGNGNCSININGVEYPLTGVNGDIFIDSTEHLAWDLSGKSVLGMLQFERYPILPKNSNIRISASGGVTKLEVMPLWRRIF